jgi:hypothetical protein
VHDERDDRERRGRGDAERQSDDVVQVPFPSCRLSNPDQILRHAPSARHDDDSCAGQQSGLWFEP